MTHITGDERSNDPRIVYSNNVERLRLTPTGLILIGGSTPEAAAIILDTTTGEMVGKGSEKLNEHAGAFLDALSAMLPEWRKRIVLEERERCARIPYMMIGVDVASANAIAEEILK